VSTDQSAPAPFIVTKFEPADSERWDRFVLGSPNGTFLHTRRYLGYHRDRFTDESLLVTTSTGMLVAVLPAAAAPDRSTPTVVTHPGITFGGLVYDDRLRGERLVQALAGVLESLADRGFTSLDYRPVPAFARRALGDEDVYAAFRLGAERISCHLSAVVDVAHRRAIDAKKRNMLRKAQRSGITLHDGVDRLSAYWALLTRELGARYAATPVHSLPEITELAGLFPDAIQLRVAEVDGVAVAGALTYRYREDVIHTQYLAADESGRNTSALELVCDSILGEASEHAVRYVSFGPSTHEEGHILNDSLYRFKHSFGATGVAIEGFRLPCRAS
jgi:hypothetical protein